MSVEPTPLYEVYFENAAFIYGMRMTYVGNTTLTVAQGFARDSTNMDNIYLALPPQNNLVPITTPFTLNSAISGAGGLDTGTLAASTLYYVYAIASSRNSRINLPPSQQESLAVPPFTTPDATSPVVQDGYYVQATVLMSASLTPLLPAGYDMFRRIGTVRTDGSSHFLPFWQSGWGQNRTMRYQTAIAPGTVGTPATTYATIGALLNIVPQVVVDVLVDVAFTPNAANNVVYLAPAQNTAGGDVTRLSGPVTGSATIGQLVCPCELNTAGTPVMEIDYKCTSASDAAVFLIAGFVDAL